jgi:hypothetical protein
MQLEMSLHVAMGAQNGTRQCIHACTFSLVLDVVRSLVRGGERISESGSLVLLLSKAAMSELRSVGSRWAAADDDEDDARPLVDDVDEMDAVPWLCRSAWSARRAALLESVLAAAESEAKASRLA